jgi:lipopolysaccharide transport system permease protein
VIPFRPMSATTELPAAFRHDAGRQGPIGLVREGIDDLWSRRRLVRYLVQADMRKRGADTLLGNLWWVIDPLLQMLVYVMFVTILNRGATTPDYPLFIFASILPWKWFTAVVGDATTSVVSQQQLIKQIAFPKIVLPVAAATAGVVGFLFGLIPLGGIMLLFPDRISPYLLLIPLIAAVQYVFSVAFGILISAGNVFFRDLGNILHHATRLWWFLSPGLYSLSTLDDVGLFKEHGWLRTLVSLNPFAILFEAYRRVIYGSADNGGSPPGFPNWSSLGILLLASLVFLALATMVFKRLEPNFAKVL